LWSINYQAINTFEIKISLLVYNINLISPFVKFIMDLALGKPLAQLFAKVLPMADAAIKKTRK
jgi:hypothetical protein